MLRKTNYPTLQIAYRATMRKAFAIAYDVYVEVMHQIEKQVDNTVFVDTHAKLRSTCPPCCYKLKDEKELPISMLTAMDGNESLKRVFRTKQGTTEDDAPEGIAYADSRVRKSHIYISRSDVNLFKDEVKASKKKEKAKVGDE